VHPRSYPFTWASVLDAESNDEGGTVTTPDMPDIGSVCVVCGGLIGWINCPTGGWWAHVQHPADNHDAIPFPGICPICGRPIIDHDDDERKGCHDAASGYQREAP
jgi:hypothetical protein